MNTFSQVVNEKHSKAIKMVLAGATTITFQQGGVIKKIRKDGAYFYAVRSGRGTGANVFTSTILIEAIKEASDYGWGDIID
jgi:hypothetical protein